MKSILKKVAGVAAGAVIALGVAGCSSDGGSSSHEHTFAKTYSQNETHHWFAATCEHTDQVKDKAEHSFGEWNITLQPTETAEGVKEKECSVCGYKATETIAKNDHTHTFEAEWTNNTTHHWHAATCEHTKEEKDKAEHNFGEWKIITEPTEKAEGTKERECSVCHYKATETIAKLEHVHTFATTYTSDATHHWHVATCEHTAEVKNKAEHSFGEWNITLQPTETAEGVKEKECSVCGYKATETIAKIDHTHTFAAEWTNNTTHHWHAATCEHTKEEKDKAEHSFGEWKIITKPTEKAEGTKERECSVCHYKATEAIAKLEHVHAKGTQHEAVAGTCKTKGTIEYYDCTKSSCEVKLDADGNPLATTEGVLNPANHEETETTFEAIAAANHKEIYKCCNAVKTAEAAHTFGAWTSNNDATKTADGTKSRTCIACSYKETVTDEGSKLPDYSTCVVGDFILKDGTILGKDETPASGTVAAVIVRSAARDQPALGVGIVHNKMAWCTSSASGYSNNITDLEGDKTSGYIDGSNSWALLVAACYDLKYATAETIETVAQKYPAFNYCRKYGTSNNLTGDLAKGWYLPTVAELYKIYQNKETVNASLSKAGGSQFGRVAYWSCCPSYDYYSWVLSFTDRGNISYFKKSYDTYCVCSVRAFN